MNAFMKLVAEMRDVQKGYFQTRDPALIPRAKTLEAAVDRAIEDARTPSLFPNDSGEDDSDA